MHLICTYAFLEEFDMSGRMMMGGLCIQTLHMKMFHLYHTYNKKKLVNFFFFKDLVISIIKSITNIQNQMAKWVGMWVFYAKPN